MALYTDSLTGITQAGGAESFAIPSDWQTLQVHQIQAKPDGALTAGILKIGVKTPGAPDFDIVGEIDLVNGPLIARFEALAEGIQLTPVGLDAPCDAYLACGMVA